MRVRKTDPKKLNLADRASMRRLLIPVVMELIFTFIIANLNSLIISRFSADAVAATTAVGTFLSLMLNLYSVFYAGAGILLAPLWGCERYKEGSGVWTVALFDSFLLSLFLAAIGITGHGLLCRWLKVPLELQDMAGTYLAITLGLSVFQSFTLTFSTAFRAIGSMQVAMLGNTLINGSCVFMNYLVLTLVPAQKQTIGHYALAGIAAQILGCLFYFWMVWRDEHIQLRLFRPDWRKKTLQTTGKIFRLGFFGGMEGVIYLLTQTIVISMIGLLGREALMVKGYSANIMNYLTLPANAFTIVSATMIGRAIGRRNEEQAKQCIAKCLKLGLASTAGLEVAAVLLGRSILRIYLSDDAMLDACMQLILVGLAVELVRCTAAIVVSALKTIGDVRTPFIMVIVGGVLNIGVSWLLGIRLGMGLPGIWIGYGADLAFRSAVGLWVWQRHTRRHTYPILGQTADA